MPTMWFAKDGPRPNSQSGRGIPISCEEAQEIVGLYKTSFAGTNAPSINLHKPSYSLKNVVLEIDEEIEVSSLFPKVGFYIVADLTPEEAKSVLSRSA